MKKNFWAGSVGGNCIFAREERGVKRTELPPLRYAKKQDDVKHPPILGTCQKLSYRVKKCLFDTLTKTCVVVFKIKRVLLVFGFVFFGFLKMS